MAIPRTYLPDNLGMILSQRSTRIPPSSLAEGSGCDWNRSVSNWQSSCSEAMAPSDGCQSRISSTRGRQRVDKRIWNLLCTHHKLALNSKSIYRHRKTNRVGGFAQNVRNIHGFRADFYRNSGPGSIKRGTAFPIAGSIVESTKRGHISLQRGMGDEKLYGSSFPASRKLRPPFSLLQSVISMIRPAEKPASIPIERCFEVP